MIVFDASMERTRPILFDTFGESMEWDGVQLKAIVEELESGVYQADAGVTVLRKLVCVQNEDIQVAPEVGDEIRLRFDPFKVDQGDFWTVEHVASGYGMYDVTLFRYVSL